MKYIKFLVVGVLLVSLTGTAFAGDFVFDENSSSCRHSFSVMDTPVIEYDQWGNVAKMYSLFYDQPLTNYEAWEYDGDHTLLKYTRCLDDKITEYTYEYDAHGFLIKTSITGGSVVRYENEYDEQGRILSSTSSTGSVIVYEHAEDGSYKKIYDSGTTFEYGRDGLLDRECQPNTLVRTYDDRGNILSTVYSDCAQSDLYTYSEEGVLLQLSSTSYSGDSTFVYDFDAQGRLVKAAIIVSENDNENRSLEYNSEGVVIRREENGATFEFRDDATNKRSDYSDGSYNIYNQDGNIQKQVTADGCSYIYLYDENGRYLANIYYDADGNRGFHQFTPEEQLFFEEDKLYRASIEDNEIIGYTVYEHDADGNLLSHREILADEYTP